VAERKTLAKNMEADSGDEALQKYKANLIGNAQNIMINEKDPRQIFFDKLMIEPEGKDAIALEPSKLKADEIAFTLKEDVNIVFE